jgi:tetratricopeptide (TPR) repeat protein
MPYIESTYRTHPFRILMGHSLAGLFGIQTFTRHPKLFQAIIAAAPSIYWNQHEWIGEFSDFLSGLKSLKGNILISMDGQSEVNHQQMEKVAAAVKKYNPKDLYFDYKYFPEETHVSLAIPALFHALKLLFSDYMFSGEREPWTYGSKGIKAHFDKASQRYGYTIPIPEDFLIDHTLHGLDRHNGVDEAIDIFQFTISLYPKSVRAHLGLAKAYHRKGKKPKAIEFYNKVLILDPKNKRAKKKLAELKR